MANRAYLFASDALEPHSWRNWLASHYYDSRHRIPLAWFFFYRVKDIQFVEVNSFGASWQEVKLAALKSDAVNVFKQRFPVLMEIATPRLDASHIERLVEDVSNWPGRYLLMNPVEVVEDDENEVKRFREIITAIDANPTNPTAMLEAASFYTGNIQRADEDRRILNIVGATYWN